MADGEKHVSLAGLKAVYDHLNNNTNDLKSALDDSGLYTNKPIGIAGYKTISIAINTASPNKWSDSGKSKFIPVSVVGKKIRVKSNSTNGSVICFLTSNVYTKGATVTTFANGTSRTFIPAGETMEYAVPSDCLYINILDNWSNDYLPEYIITDRSALPDSMSGDMIGLTIPDDQWTSYSCVISTSYRTFGDKGNIQGNTDWASTYDLMASAFIPVHGKMLQLPVPWSSGSSSPSYGMSLYDENFNPIYGRAVSAWWGRTENDDYVVFENIYLPDNAKYFRTTYWSDEMRAEHPNAIPEFSYNLLKEIPDEYKPITHELPVDTYMQNAIRRARQLTDIKWTPRVNIPRYSMLNGGSDHFLDWFYQDHEYVGIPYSGAGKGEGSSSGWTAPEEWGYAHKWVGGCIPFEAFVTAARYQNSVFSETVEQSEPNYDSSPFGIVCTGLVNYTVNGPWPLRGITNFFDTSDGVFRKPSSNNTISVINRNDIMIGDFLYTQTHVIVITDIIRDADGNVTHVEMSEATTVGNSNNSVLGTKFGGVARRKMWEYSEFKRLYGSYVKYRRTTFYGIPYEPSKYVDTGNEGDRENIQDLPCIPYLGNGAIYREGYIHNSKICIGATGFTSLVVTKDGEAFGTFDVTGLTEVSVGFSAVGSYEAYLTNGTTQTMSCNWSVVSGTM